MFGWTARQGSGPRARCGRPDVGHCNEVAGLLSGTRVATPGGWRAVETIVAGDEVLTFDAGMQVVTKVTHAPLWFAETHCPRSLWPLEVPRGALGNNAAFLLMPGQTVLIESDAAEEFYGDPFALVPVAALDGVRGIWRVPPRLEAHAVTLQFETEQVVFAESGAMFLCPVARDILDAAASEEDETAYRVLPMEEAREITSLMDRPARTHRPSRPFWSAVIRAA